MVAYCVIDLFGYLVLFTQNVQVSWFVRTILVSCVTELKLRSLDWFAIHIMYT